MKSILFFLLLLSSLFSFSQTATDTIFFNKDWKRINSTEPVYVYGFKDYNENGAGVGKYYYSSGELHSVQEEVNNVKEGKCIWYYKNGNTWLEGSYKNDNPIDTCYRYGKLTSFMTYEVYVNGEMNSSFSINEDGRVFYITCDELPAYGNKKSAEKSKKAFYKYLRKKMKYPKTARKAGVQGRVYVQFVINKTGTVENVKIVKGVHPMLDKLVVRGVEAMPDWRSAKHNGECVEVLYTLPVNFKITE